MSALMKAFAWIGSGLVCVCAGACGDDGAREHDNQDVNVGGDGADVADAVDDSDDLEVDVVVPTCPTLGPAVVEVGEGGLARFDATGPGDLFAGTSGDLRATHLGDVVTVRAPYVAGDQPVSLRAAGCADATATLRVRPWTLTSVTWDAGDGPEEREHPTLWIDASAPDTLVVSSGYGFVPQQFTPLWDMWEFDLVDGGWTRTRETRDAELQIGLGGRAAARPSADGAGFMLQGGEGPATELAGGVLTWTGSRWVAGGDGGPPLQLHAFFRAGDDGPWLATLGLRQTPTGFAFERDVWQFDPVGDAWTKLALSDSNRPSGRYGFAYAWDAPARRLVVVSGARSPTATDPVNAAPDTWALELEGPSDSPTGAHWFDLVPSGDTPRARNGCWAYDLANRRMFVFGGTADQATAIKGLHVLELDTGIERWIHLLDHPAMPPVRASCAAAWDAARGRLVLGFGNSDAGLFRDLQIVAF